MSFKGVQISKELHNKLKLACAIKGKPMRNLADEIIREWLDKNFSNELIFSLESTKEIKVEEPKLEAKTEESKLEPKTEEPKAKEEPKIDEKFQVGINNKLM